MALRQYYSVQRLTAVSILVLVVIGSLTAGYVAGQAIIQPVQSASPQSVTAASPQAPASQAVQPNASNGHQSAPLLQNQTSLLTTSPPPTHHGGDDDGGSDD